jgi:hypothetical protein
MSKTKGSPASIVPKKNMTVLITQPDTEAIIAEAIRITGQKKTRAGNDLIRLAAKIRRFPIVGEVKQ